MENNVVENVAVEAVETTAVTTAVKSSKKSGLIIGGATAATLGVGVGIYFLVKAIKKKKAAKTAEVKAEPATEAKPENK